MAPKIYYMGYAGVVNIAGLRIAGISGIYKGFDYSKGHFEKPPYDSDAVRTVYHVRKMEIFRMKQVCRTFDAAENYALGKLHLRVALMFFSSVEKLM